MAAAVGIGPGTARAGPGSTPPAAAPRLVSGVADLPDRLLLVLLWVSLAVAAAVVAGQHRPVVVVPAAVALVVLTWRWRPVPPPAGRSDAAAAVTCLLLVTGWAAVQVPLVGERLLVTRDPDIYTLTALWLVDHSALAIPVPPGGAGTVGFDLVDGAWLPQGSHLLPALSAVLGWVGGETAVLASGLAWGAAGLLALFTLGRRVLGPWWALLPPAGLGLSLPMLDLSRSLYTEPLALALSMLGAALLMDAWRSRRLRDLLLVGVALGAVSLARVDGTVTLVGVVVGLTPLALAGTPGTGRDPLRWGSLVVAAGAAPPVAVSVADLLLRTGVYAEVLWPRVAVLLGATGVAAVVATGLTALPDRLLDGYRRVLPRLAPVLGVALLLGLAALASRRLWLVTRVDTPNPVVVALQALEDPAADPLRRYDELSVAWLTWYWGVPVVAAGFLAWSLWSWLGLREPRRGRLVGLLLVVLPSALSYLYRPSVTPDQVWAARRFVPVVAPALLLGAVWVAAALARRRENRRMCLPLAAVLAAAVVAWPASTLPGLWHVRDRGGMLAGVDELCRRVAGRPAVVSGLDTFAPTVRVVCDVPTYALVDRAPTAADLAAARAVLGGGDVALVTRDPAALPWRGAPPEPVDIVFSRWERTLLGPPQAGTTAGTLVTVGELEVSGRVSAG